MFAVALERSSAFSGAVIAGIQKGVVDMLGGGRIISRTKRLSEPRSCVESPPSEILPLIYPKVYQYVCTGIPGTSYH